MITKEDFEFITAYDTADAAGRANILKERKGDCARTFLNLLEHVSKDQTVQYVLVLIDDMLQVSFWRCLKTCLDSGRSLDRNKEGFEIQKDSVSWRGIFLLWFSFLDSVSSISGRPNESGRLPRVLFEKEGTRLRFVSEFAKRLRWIHHQYVIQNYSKDCLLVTGCNRWNGFEILPYLAARPVDNFCKSLSSFGSILWLIFDSVCNSNRIVWFRTTNTCNQSHVVCKWCWGSTNTVSSSSMSKACLQCSVFCPGEWISRFSINWYSVYGCWPSILVWQNVWISKRSLLRSL